MKLFLGDEDQYAVRNDNAKEFTEDDVGPGPAIAQFAKTGEEVFGTEDLEDKDAFLGEGVAVELGSPDPG